MALINRYNFLRWSKPLTPGYTPEIPLAYKIGTDTYLPYLVPGERTSFYIAANTHQDLDFTLRLINTEGIEASGDIASISKVEANNLFEFYCSFICPNIPDGFYKLAIFFDRGIVLESNIIYLISNGYEKISSIIKFRNSRLLYGINYESLPGDFYQQIRLAITEIDRQTQNNIDQYRSSYKRNLRNLYNVTDEFVTFETYYFDSLAHEAMVAALDHDEIYINNLKFTIKTGHKITTHHQNPKTKGQFEMWNDKFTHDAKFDNTDEVTLDLIFWNVEKSQVFRKNNCGAGYRGMDYTYNVAAHTYNYAFEQHTSVITQGMLNSAQGYADAKALSEIATNGQNEANLKGGCIASNGTTILSIDFSSWSIRTIQVGGDSFSPLPVNTSVYDPHQGQTDTRGTIDNSTVVKENNAMRVNVHGDFNSNINKVTIIAVNSSSYLHAGVSYGITLDVVDFVSDSFWEDGRTPMALILIDVAGVFNQIKATGFYYFEYTPAFDTTPRITCSEGSFLIDNLLIERLN